MPKNTLLGVLTSISWCARKKDKSEREPEQPDTPPSTSGSRKTIELRSGGGQVTLSVSIDPMELEDDDKDFVFALISALKRYEKGATPIITLGVANSGAAES